MTPEEAHEISRKEKPEDKLRRIVCQDPEWAYMYARHVDKGSHYITREAACKDPMYAYYYALYVDKYPSDLTRNGASKDPYYAYCYARDVDKCFSENTYTYVPKI